MGIINMKTTRVDFFTKQTSDATSKVLHQQTYEVRNGQLNLARFKGTLYMSGGFGGGTCKLQAYDGETWHDVTGVSRTTPGYNDVDIDAVAFQLVLAGATAATLNACMISAHDLVEKT